jgi:hypothetical protein
MYVDMKIMTEILQQQFDENIFARSLKERRLLVRSKRLIIFPRQSNSYDQRFSNLMAFQYRHRTRLLHCFKSNS